MRKGKNAWTWAKNRIGSESHPGYCKRFTRMAFAIPSKSGSAAEAWRNTKHKKKPKDINDVPPYVPAYFDTGVNGHVVITGPKDSLGRRLCISVDVQDSDRDGRREVGLVPLQSLTSWGPFLGYGLDFDGVTVAEGRATVKIEVVEQEHGDKKSVREIAQEVIDGEWGDGVERKNRLQKAGYAYTAVQNEVNVLLKRR